MEANQTGPLAKCVNCGRGWGGYATCPNCGGKVQDASALSINRTPPPAQRLYFLVAVDVDRSAILADNPPEDVGECIAGELRAHLDEKGVRGACGIVAYDVATDVADIMRNLRKALHYYAVPDVGWAEAEHATAYEDSRCIILDDAEETEQARKDREE